MGRGRTPLMGVGAGSGLMSGHLCLLLLPLGILREQDLGQAPQSPVPSGELHSKRQEKQVQKRPGALSGVAQWIEHRPVNQRVTGLIPSQGTCLGYLRPGPQ